MVLLWILIVLFLLMSIAFFFGKGSFLIAGYNTASQEEKAKYDETKLCRIMGFATLVITVSLLLAQLFEDLALYVVISGTVVCMAIVFIGSRTYAKNSNIEWVEKKKEDIKWYKSPKVYTSLSSVVVLIVVGVMLLTGDVKIEINSDSLTANAFLTSSTTIEFDDIEKVELSKDIKLGSRTWGIGSFKINAGNFKNDVFGKYKLYANTKCHSYVVLTTKDGYVVLNEVDEEKTNELYQKVQQAIQ